jgi:HD-GYP domain-containing protein (c-di-GMP phosphodiesterase class II)
VSEGSPAKVKPEGKSIAEARAALLEQTQHEQFDITPCIEAIELLEGLPLIGTVDDRVQLALDTTRCLGGTERAGLALRALRAAIRPGNEVIDPYLQRKWLLFVGVIETHTGHPGAAIRHLAASLELATELNDVMGIGNVWNNLSQLAAGAGQYEDAVRYTTLALDAVEMAGGSARNSFSQEFMASAYVNRANALHRLGRLDAAVSDAGNAVVNAFLTTASTPNAIGVALKTIALCLLAGIRIQRRELVQAEMLLEVAESLHTRSTGMDSASLYTQWVRGELLVAGGHVADGIALLEHALAGSLMSASQNASDDPVIDILHALQRACSAVGEPRKADLYLSRIGERLRANAARALAALTDQPQFSRDRDPATALRAVDKYLHGIASRDIVDEAHSTRAWQDLVGMAASASAVEEHSGEHGVRVASLCGLVARSMGLGEDAISAVEQAGLLHDLGKVGVPLSVLTKKEGLSDHEAELLERHADEGANLIERSTAPNRARLAELVRMHHQPFNHGGSPEAHTAPIPIEARILSACDRFDARIAGRPRKPAVAIAEALQEMFGMADLDPRVVEALIGTVRQLQREHENLIDFLAIAADDYDYTSARRLVRRAAGCRGE